ncbi:group III truncated hemoglobin [Euzebyella saccharophila]|uniref:Group III truncated hemoglobin n=1 Tax=Euzebyella saccharophila TaxID=679664 RepID=A0ABV8JPT7_9FLAO|nr:group III truncated hemoglobin [Euzebyella saccharophila]
MKKREIKNREDVHLLVTQFYGKIREHATLSPIFNKIIEDWDAHFEVLTNFWESQLFLKRNYHNNPIQVHNEVDRKMEHQIKSEHFGMWLNLWFETLDELFEGEVAYIAKNRAQKMSSMLFIEMFKARPK